MASVTVLAARRSCLSPRLLFRQSWRHAALVAGPCSKHYPLGCGVEQLICLIDVTLRLLYLTSPARVVRPANQDVGIVYLRAKQPGASAIQP